MMRSNGKQLSTLEAWAGIECTVNRVGDTYFDQSHRNGHQDRIDDLDLIAGVGVTRLRYPVIWERIAPGRLEAADWSWTDARLGRLQQLQLPPIATLLHHGSGPRHTSLVDPAFPDLLAEYARAVARRYPWIDAYTPVNEPLTTARFSGLYGHWFPHGTDDNTFLRALLGECKATVLAMRAIRSVHPGAMLVQTEDLGFCHSTPKLAYEAKFQNTRRWLSMDLLCGRMKRTHDLWPYLRKSGISEAELLWFRDNPCPPDVMGFNYYITSERYLDEHVGQFPAWSHASNTRHRFADVHSVLAGRLVGVDTLLRQAYDRFHVPLALTEVHLGSTREQQLRWVADIYDRVQRVRQEVPVVAMTAWSVLGAYDWHCLVTRCENVYEPGLFDVRGPQPRATALAKAWAEIAAGSRPQHPAADGPGWWELACSRHERAA
ncbi:MAG TPA: family 1 glycosylhydrolase [Kofleriaceae bacterium]|jgi:dTDP-4-dehydrorhamnose reductase